MREEKLFYQERSQLRGRVYDDTESPRFRLECSVLMQDPRERTIHANRCRKRRSPNETTTVSFPVLVSLLALAGTNAVASPFQLTFVGLQNNEEVLNYYNGGTGSLGSGPGINYGVTFTPSFIAIAVSGFPGSPDVGTLNGSSAIMNVSRGIDEVFSFYYGSPSNSSGSVALWSGLNGTGTLLNTINLPAEPGFNPVSALGDGAMSVVFSGSGVEFGLISNTPSPVIPEPSSLLLAGTGLAGLAAWVRRRVCTGGAD
jgi:hypothetical protein